MSKVAKLAWNSLANNLTEDKEDKSSGIDTTLANCLSSLIFAILSSAFFKSRHAENEDLQLNL